MLPNSTLETLLNVITTVHQAPDVTPDEMRRYLANLGWRFTKNWSTNGFRDTFAEYTDGVEYIGVPLKSDFGDYVGCCIDFMRDVANATGKTQLRVWYELTQIAEQRSRQ